MQFLGLIACGSIFLVATSTGDGSQPNPLPIRGSTEEICYCHAQGDPHYQTYDGNRFSLALDCSFILSQFISNKGGCSFRVEVENEKNASSEHPTIAFTNIVKVIVGPNMCSIGQGQVVQVNGAVTTLPYQFAAFNIQIVDNFVVIILPCGVIIKFDGRTSVWIIVPRTLASRGRLWGICGNCDKIRYNDWVAGTSNKPIQARIRALAKRYAVNSVFNSRRPRCQALTH